MKDRITLAWETRRDIHAFVVKHGRVSMEQIFADFTERKLETVRKSVIRLRKSGDVGMYLVQPECGGRAGVYYAITSAIRPEAETRKAMSDGAHKTLSNLRNWNKRQSEQKKPKGDKFDRAAELRQRILDHTHAHGMATAQQIAQALNIRTDHALRSLYKMEVNGEVQRHGSGLGLQFSAVQITTMSAAQMRDRVYHNWTHSIADTEAKKRQAESSRKIVLVGRYIHTPTNPIPNQGGQGRSSGPRMVSAMLGE
jgi:predicted ArsR family transcriptional regulator